MSRRIKFFWLLLALLVTTGCVSASAPPAPIAEIPSLLTFPEDVSIDLSTIGGDSPSTAPAAIKLQTTTENNFSEIISLGPILINMANDLLDTLLDPLQSLQIPVSPQVRNFEGLINLPGILPQKLKVDFAAYDFNGDGIPEGTGCTCPLGCAVQSCPSEALSTELQPIAYRIWIQNFDGNFERFMAGIFEIIPVVDDPNTPANEENPGTGQFRVKIQNLTGSTTDRSQDLAFGVIYEHRNFSNPLNQSTEMFVQDKEFSKTEPKPLVDFTNFHSLADQVGVAREGIPPTLQKTAKMSFQQTPSPVDGPEDFQYIGRFLEDFNFWSGSFIATGMEEGAPKSVSGENICALISNGDETARQNCIDLGIDVAGESFLAPTVENDVALPADFPPTPTF